MLNGVIFDLDGTLGDTLPVCFAAFRTVFREHLGTEHTDSEIRAMFGPSEEGVLSGAIGNVPTAMDEYLAAYATAHAEVPTPFTGVEELLDRLDSAAVPTAVVTGKGPRSAAISLEQWSLTSRFTMVAAGSETGNVKPANMRLVLDTWGVDPAGVVSVGDAPSDVSSARANGIVAVGAAWAGGVDVGRLAAMRPDAIFSTVAEFDGWLSRRIGI